MSPGEVFRLEEVAVEFRLNAIHERSLHALARLLRGRRCPSTARSTA
jgi:hypothetical protein